jgi:polysaccharide export outer membrane protein
MRRLLCALVWICAAGCAAAPAASTAAQQQSAAASAAAERDPKQVAEAEEAALAQAMRLLAKPKSDYRLTSADLLDVTVYGDSEVTRKVRIGQNGNISLPLIGSVKIGGMTILEATDALNEKLKKFYVDPQVSLFIEEYGNKQIFVLGEVNRPGSYPIPSESHMTVLEAVSTAGGFTPVAGLDRTRILRDVNGKSEIIMIEVTAITKLGQKEKDLVLQPNDVVFVPQSFF